MKLSSLAQPAVDLVMQRGETISVTGRQRKEQRDGMQLTEDELIKRFDGKLARY